MKWEEHVEYLTFLANKARSSGNDDPFRAYAILAAVQKHKHRLEKTPISIRGFSFFDVFTSTRKSLIAELPVVFTPYDGGFNRSRTVEDFLNKGDVDVFRLLLNNEAFQGVTDIPLLRQIVRKETEIALSMPLSRQQEQDIAGELWEVLRQSLLILSQNFKLVRPKKNETAVLRRVWNVVCTIFAFMKHSLHDAKWLDWLIKSHGSSTVIATRINRALSLGTVVPNHQQQDSEVGDGVQDVDLKPEVNIDTTAIQTITRKAYAWLELVCYPMVQVETVLNHLKKFKSVGVTIVSSPDVDRACQGWKEAIRTAYKTTCIQQNLTESEAFTAAESVITKIENTLKNGTAKEKKDLQKLHEDSWMFGGQVHCESILVSESLQSPVSGRTSTLFLSLNRSLTAS